MPWSEYVCYPTICCPILWIIKAIDIGQGFGATFSMLSFLVHTKLVLGIPILVLSVTTLMNDSLLEAPCTYFRGRRASSSYICLMAISKDFLSFSFLVQSIIVFVFHGSFSLKTFILGARLRVVIANTMLIVVFFFLVA